MLEADNEREAREVAALMGILVESVAVAPAATPVADHAGLAPKSQPAGSGTYDEARKAARKLSRAAAPCAIVGWILFGLGLLVAMAGAIALIDRPGSGGAVVSGVAAVIGAIPLLLLAGLLEYLGAMGLVVCDIADNTRPSDRQSSRP